ncbi:MAG: hypothetical protein AB7S74_11780 [Hyphomicrobium sp.]
MALTYFVAKSMYAYNPRKLEADVLRGLMRLPEFELSGFTARAGLTGCDVTVLKDRSFFGSWRASERTLTWTYANGGGSVYFAQTVEQAIRHTMLMVLRSLEAQRRAAA